MDINIERITVGEWDENVYLIYGEQDLVIVDPGDEAERLIARIEEIGCTPRAVLITHGHFDHIGAVCQLVERYKILFYIHSSDKRLLRQANFYRKMSHSKTFIEIPRPNKFLDNENVLAFGEIALEVMHVPGHTNGSVCFKMNNDLISGDLIFEYDEGRTDLPESDPDALRNSIRSLVEGFPDCTIHPGHGNSFKTETINLSAYQ